MDRKKIYAVVLAVLAVVVSGAGISYGFMSRGRVGRQAVEQAIELYDQTYGRYYSRTGMTAELTERQTDGRDVEEYFTLEVRHILEADSPDDLAYCQGMLQWCVQNDFFLGKIQDTSMYQTLWYDMKEGGRLRLEMKASYPKGNRNRVTVFVKEGEDYIPFSDWLPDDLFSWGSGYQYMEEVFGEFRGITF